MTKFFRLFYSKTLFLAYGASWILTLFFGLVNVYNVNRQSVEFSTAFFAFSVVIFFLLFFVLESNRIYQFFRATDIRLLPVSTGKLYFYNIIFSIVVGASFFIGNAMIGLMMNYIVIHLPIDFNLNLIECIAAIVDIVVVFLVIQFLVCLYSAIRQFVQKRFRCFLEIALFIIFTILMDYFSAFDLGRMSTLVANAFGLKQELYFRIALQVLTAFLYFSLSIWVINRYVEAEDR